MMNWDDYRMQRGLPVPRSVSTIDVRVVDMTGLFPFKRENPHEPVKDREYGSVFVYGRTRYGWARKTHLGWEFSIC